MAMSEDEFRSYVFKELDRINDELGRLRNLFENFDHQFGKRYVG